MLDSAFVFLKLVFLSEDLTLNASSMRGGKDWNNKAMEPLFPRLHVKDTEKGGPKPPPRNKMAVYEELTCPSSSFINGSIPMFPLHQNGGSQIRHAESSGQVGVSERRPFPVFYGSTASTHKSPRLVHSSQFSGLLSNISANSAVKPLGYATSSISGNSLMTVRSCSSQQTNFIHFKRPSFDEDKVETLFPSSACQGESVDSRAKKRGLGQEKMNSLSMKSSIQIQQHSSENRLKRASVRDQDQEDHSKMSASSLQKVAFVSTVRTNVAPQESFLCSGIPKSSSPHSCQPDKRSEMLLEKNIIALKDSETDQPYVLQNSHGSLLRTETCSGSLICYNGVLANDSQCTEESDNKFVEPGVFHRNEDASDSTRVDNVTRVNISPDDVVQMIGQENFWKIRQILVNQQRMFSAQVFELHRLVQVQKSIAGSSHHFIEDGLCLHKGLDEESNNDKSPLSSRPLPSPPPNNQSSKLKTAPVGTDKSIKPYSYVLPTPPPPPPLIQSIYPRPENQWLVPFMSSEGLVYKPYPGPCLPNATGGPYFLQAVGPAGGGLYFLNTAYGIPDSTQQGERVVPGIPITMCYRGSQEHAVVEDMTSYFPCFSSHHKADADRQGSTGSSSVERSSEPIATHELIKAVPRDGRLASETAMRIFQSIQEERKQNEVPNLHK